MQYTIIQNPQTKATEKVSVGFSLTFFVFGFWVPLLRGDIGWAFATLFAFVVALILGPFACAVYLIYHVYMSINYNKIYLDEKLLSGWEYKE